MIEMQKISDYVHEFIEINTDPRTKDKFLVSSPLPTIVLSVLYLVAVVYILPAYMKNRPAFQLKNTLIYYNAFQVLLSAYIVYLSYGSGYVRRYRIIGCRELDQSTTDPDAIMAMNGIHIYFLSKFTEFLDTVFFVLRKKENQISFLHLFHHASMPFGGYLMARFTPGGSAAMISGTNALIHVVMYTYYMLAASGPKWQKYLWWKKYLTTFQMVQFVYGLVQCVALSLTRHNCPLYFQRYPLMIYFIVYVSILLILFYQFYKSSYKKAQTKKME